MLMLSDEHHTVMSSIVSGPWKKKLVVQRFLFLWKVRGEGKRKERRKGLHDCVLLPLSLNVRPQHCEDSNTVNWAECHKGADRGYFPEAEGCAGGCYLSQALWVCLKIVTSTGGQHGCTRSNDHRLIYSTMIPELGIVTVLKVVTWTNHCEFSGGNCDVLMLVSWTNGHRFTGGSYLKWASWMYCRLLFNCGELTGCCYLNW